MNERLRDLFRRARLVSGSPNNAPAIVAALLGDGFRDELLANDETHRLILSAGLSHIIRGALKEVQGDDAKETARLRVQQLNLWPEGCRSLVRDIDREMVFVPSRNEYVELVPDALTDFEITEAGKHLISKGRECIARGNVLLRLAALRGTGEAA